MTTGPTNPFERGKQVGRAAVRQEKLDALNKVLTLVEQSPDIAHARKLVWTFIQSEKEKLK